MNLTFLSTVHLILRQIQVGQINAESEREAIRC